jgi:hypothetical protein
MAQPDGLLEALYAASKAIPSLDSVVSVVFGKTEVAALNDAELDLTYSKSPNATEESPVTVVLEVLVPFPAEPEDLVALTFGDSDVPTSINSTASATTT